MYLLQDTLGEKPMPKPVDLLQGTLDMLILKAVSLGPLHGYGVLLRIQQIRADAWRSSRALCTRRCFGSSIRGSSPASGVNRRTSAGPSSTRSPPRGAVDSRSRRAIGIAWRTSSPASSELRRRSCDLPGTAPIRHALRN